MAFLASPDVTLGCPVAVPETSPHWNHTSERALSPWPRPAPDRLHHPSRQGVLCNG